MGETLKPLVIAQCLVLLVILGLETRAAVVDAADASIQARTAVLRLRSSDLDLVGFAGPFALLAQFDSLVAARKGLEKEQGELAALPLDEAVRMELDRFSVQLADRTRKIERLKSLRGQLTNLEHYIPVRLEELRRRAPDDPSIPEVRSLLLSYLLDPSEQRLHDLQNFTETLKTQPATAPLQEIAPHLKVFVDARGELFVIAHEFLKSDLARGSDRVARAEDAVCAGHRRTAWLLRVVGLLTALGLALAGLWTRR